MSTLDELQQLCNENLKLLEAFLNDRECIGGEEKGTLEAPSDRALATKPYGLMLERRRLTAALKRSAAAPELFDDVDRDLAKYFTSLAPAEILGLAERGAYEACHIGGEPIWPILT